MFKQELPVVHNFDYIMKNVNLTLCEQISQTKKKNLLCPSLRAFFGEFSLIVSFEINKFTSIGLNEHYGVLIAHLALSAQTKLQLKMISHEKFGYFVRMFEDLNNSNLNSRFFLH